MRQGDKPGASDSLAKAAQELNDLMQQLADAQSLMAALAACQKPACASVPARAGASAKARRASAPAANPVAAWAPGPMRPAGPTNPNRDELVDNSGVQRPEHGPARPR